MTRIVNVDQGDYVIKVQPGNNIVLKGNVDVKGSQTTVNSTDTTISDNIFTLNTGEIGPGINVPIKLGLSGFKIDRGGSGGSTVTTVNGVTVTTPIGDPLTAQVLFSENDAYYNAGTSTRLSGSFLLQTSTGAITSLSNLKLNSAELRAISNNGTNSIEFDLRNSNAVINVVNSTFNSEEYQTRVTDESLVTKKYVTSYITSGTITLGMADVDKLYKRDVDNNEASKVLATLTSIEMSIAATKIATITSSGLHVNTIKPYTGTTVNIDSILSLTDQTSSPSSIAGKTQIYSKTTEGPGRSGIFFKSAVSDDELVAKNRAVLLSMLF